MHRDENAARTLGLIRSYIAETHRPERKAASFLEASRNAAGVEKRRGGVMLRF